MTRQVSHNAPRNVKRRQQRDARMLPIVEQQVDELQDAVDAQAEMLAEFAVKPQPTK